MPPDKKRIFEEGWLSAYRNYIVKQEAPSLFHFWVGCTVIAATLRRNVYIDRGAYTLWPNLYVLLVAKSASGKKSTAMDIGMDILYKIKDVHVMSGRMTVEGLIEQMSRATADPKGIIKPDGSVLIQSDELPYLFGKASYITDLMTFLTAAYTGKARVDFLTKKSGVIPVRNPCPSLITATTPEQMGEVFPSMTLVSGFIGRIILAYGDRGKRISKPILRREMEDALLHDLYCIAQLCGEMRVTPEADAFFDEWYETLDAQIPTRELEAFYERKHDHVWKLALILSVSESDELVLTKDHLIRAIAGIQLIEDSIPMAVSHIGVTTSATTMDFVEAIIRSVYPESVSHSVLLRRVYKRLVHGASEFKDVVNFLEDQGKIKIIEGATKTSYVAILEKNQKKST